MKQRKELKQHMKMMLIIALISVMILLGKVFIGMSKGLTLQECFMTNDQIIQSWIDSDSMDRTDKTFEYPEKAYTDER